jgi:hypothetical protein
MLLEAIVSQKVFAAMTLAARPQRRLRYRNLAKEGAGKLPLPLSL